MSRPALRRPPPAPPVYRPQPVPKVLQTKTRAGSSLALPARPNVSQPLRRNVPKCCPQPAPKLQQANARALQTKPAPHTAGSATRQHPAPHTHARGVVQRSTGNVIQRAKLTYSVGFATEQATYSTAADYYYQKVLTWLFTVKGEHGQDAGDVASTVMTKAENSGVANWTDVKNYIDWVNRAIDRASSGPLKSPPAYILGVPPSKLTKIGLKYADYDDYVARKKIKQANIAPVAESDVHETLKAATGGASEVSAQVIVDGRAKTTKTSTTHKDLFSVPFTEHHNHEITDSQNDGEVAALSGALDVLIKDLKETTSNHQHKLALVGPYGACDGCKDRIKKFKQRWLDEKQKARAANATLLITYFYRNVAAKAEIRPKTMYGWKEARESTARGISSYSYWSTTA